MSRKMRAVLRNGSPKASASNSASTCILCETIPDDADWAPISFEGTLHDRASYRFYWQVLERAHRTGRTLPLRMRPWFAAPATVAP